jgi:hypothetical protein
MVEVVVVAVQAATTDALTVRSVVAEPAAIAVPAIAVIAAAVMIAKSFFILCSLLCVLNLNYCVSNKKTPISTAEIDVIVPDMTYTSRFA